VSIDTEDIESRLRSALHEIAADVRVAPYGEPTPAQPRLVDRARPRRLLIAAAAAVALVAVAATSILLLPSGNSSRVRTAGPRAALTPREIPASGKPHLDWCVAAESLDQQVAENIQRLEDLRQQIAALDDQIAQAQTVTGTNRDLLLAQRNSLVQRYKAAFDQQPLFGAEAQAAHANCDEQQTKPPRCFRNQRLTEAQWNDLETQMREFEAQIAAEVGVTPPASQTAVLAYRCPAPKTAVFR